MTTRGVELVGPLPSELQSYVVFTAGTSSKSKSPEAAQQLLDLLLGPVALPVIRTQGMKIVAK